MTDTAPVYVKAEELTKLRNKAERAEEVIYGRKSALVTNGALILRILAEREQKERAVKSAWRDMSSAPRPDEDAPEVLLLQDGRRFIGQWDSAAGQWQGLHAFDGIECYRYFQEWPGRLYSPSAWSPVPAAPQEQEGG